MRGSLFRKLALYIVELELEADSITLYRAENNHLGRCAHINFWAEGTFEFLVQAVVKPAGLGCPCSYPKSQLFAAADNAGHVRRGPDFFVHWHMKLNVGAGIFAAVLDRVDDLDAILTFNNDSA